MQSHDVQRLAQIIREPRKENHHYGWYRKFEKKRF